MVLMISPLILVVWGYIVFRDSSGSVLGGMSKFIRYATSTENVEASAGREACLLAESSRYISFGFEVYRSPYNIPWTCV